MNYRSAKMDREGLVTGYLVVIIGVCKARVVCWCLAQFSTLDGPTRTLFFSFKGKDKAETYAT